MNRDPQDSVFGGPVGSESSRLHFHVSFEDEVGVLALSGDLDCANAELLSSVLDAMFLAGVRTVEVDASGVTFMDCSILSVLLVSRRTFETSGGRFGLVRSSPFVARFFELAGISRASDPTTNGRSSNGHSRSSPDPTPI